MAIAAPEQLNVTEVPAWGSRSVDCFEKLEQIGEGTYGYFIFLDFLLNSCCSDMLLGNGALFWTLNEKNWCEACWNQLSCRVTLKTELLSMLKLVFGKWMLLNLLYGMLYRWHVSPTIMWMNCSFEVEYNGYMWIAWSVITCKIMFSYKTVWFGFLLFLLRWEFVPVAKFTWQEKSKQGRLLLWRRYEWTMKEKGYAFQPGLSWSPFHLKMFSLIMSEDSNRLCIKKRSQDMVINCRLICLQFPITAIREIKILKKLHHENVIKLKEIVTSTGDLMIFFLLWFYFHSVL